MDVICRAVSTSLFLSHGIRTDTEVFLHLLGGPGPPRRIRINGSKVRGLRPDERSIGGVISRVLQEPAPPAGYLTETSLGISHDAGDLSMTLDDWLEENFTIITLDANSPPILLEENSITKPSQPVNVGFILSDDRPFEKAESTELSNRTVHRSLGDRWLQGNVAIAIVHHLLDEEMDLDLG